MAAYTIDTSSVSNSIEAYKRQTAWQLEHAKNYVCQYLGGSRPAGLYDAGCCVSFSAVSAIAILNSAWSHFYLKNYENINSIPNPSPNPNNKFENFPQAESVDQLLKNEKVRSLSGIGEFAGVLQSLISVQKFNLPQVRLVRRIADNYKHRHIDMVNHGEGMAMEFSGGKFERDGLKIKLVQKDGKMYVQFDADYSHSIPSINLKQGDTEHLFVASIPTDLNLRSQHFHFQFRPTAQGEREIENQGACFVPEVDVFLCAGDMHIFRVQVYEHKHNPFHLLRSILPAVSNFSDCLLEYCE